MEEVMFAEEGLKAVLGEDVVDELRLTTRGYSRTAGRDRVRCVSMSLRMDLSLLAEGLES